MIRSNSPHSDRAQSPEPQRRIYRQRPRPPGLRAYSLTDTSSAKGCICQSPQCPARCWWCRHGQHHKYACDTCFEAHEDERERIAIQRAATRRRPATNGTATSPGSTTSPPSTSDLSGSSAQALSTPGTSVHVSFPQVGGVVSPTCLLAERASNSTSHTSLLGELECWNMSAAEVEQTLRKVLDALTALHGDCDNVRNAYSGLLSKTSDFVLHDVGLRIVTNSVMSVIMEIAGLAFVRMLTTQIGTHRRLVFVCILWMLIDLPESRLALNPVVITWRLCFDNSANYTQEYLSDFGEVMKDLGLAIFDLKSGIRTEEQFCQRLIDLEHLPLIQAERRCETSAPVHWALLVINKIRRSQQYVEQHGHFALVEVITVIQLLSSRRASEMARRLHLYAQATYYQLCLVLAVQTDPAPASDAVQPARLRYIYQTESENDDAIRLWRNSIPPANEEQDMAQ